MTIAERQAFIRQFIDERWFVTSGLIGDIIVVVPRDILALYPHRKAKK